VFYGFGRDAALAEDVVQETFTLALSRATDYDPVRGSAGSWLTVLSRNVIRDHLRAHRRSDELQATWERIDATLAQTFAAMAERPLPGEVLERTETRDLVHMAIANLPEQYRIVLTRKYVDGDSLETPAPHLGIPAKATQSLPPPSPPPFPQNPRAPSPPPGISAEATKSWLARARRAFRETLGTLSAHFSEAV